MQRKVYIENMPLEEAQQNWMTHLDGLGFYLPVSETIPAEAALYRLTSEAVYARRSSPHYQASAMDGIAVQAGDTFAANERNPVRLDIGRYMEVDTGDYINADFDAVIMIEDVNFVDGSAEIIKPAVPWQHIRSIGEDLVAQDMVLPSFTRIGPFELASLLTAAVSEVEVVKPPVVGIIPTGTELVDQGEVVMAPGEIVDSNSRMLSGLCQEWGALPLRHQIVVDDRDLLKEAILEIIDQVDMLVVCSGSSTGREDFTSTIIEELGELLIHGIAIRPGKPAILGVIQNKPVIGVPGYPISAQLVFSLFARPVLLKRQGLAPGKEEVLPALISRKLPSSMGVDEFIYVNCAPINGEYRAYPLNRGAGVTTSLVRADGFIQIERGSEGLEAGQACLVRMHRSRRVIDETLVCIGSHDMAIDILADLLQRRFQIRLISTNAGSMGGLMSLRRSETHLAGIHLLDTASGDYNLAYLQRYMPDANWKLYTLIHRQQGLIVKRHNPLDIQGLRDLLKPGLRFINRQKGSGTRVLLDHLLEREGISPEAIYGYNHEEYTHLAVAAAVKNDACDAGLGIYASARIMDLDFIPVAEERYELCMLPDLIDTYQMDCVLEIINSRDFQHRVMQLGGYNLEGCGTLRSL